MKPSRYNVVIENPHYDNYLLYNSMSNALLEAEKEIGAFLEGCAESQPRKLEGCVESQPLTREQLAKLSANQQEELVKSGFLVEDALDELEIMKNLDSKRLRTLHRDHKGIYLALLPSLRCNFSCFYCFEPLELRRTSSMMTAETQGKILRYLGEAVQHDELKVVAIDWFGGEPLMFPEVIDQMQGQINQIAEDGNTQVEAGVITNGFFLSRSVSDMLVERDVTTAQVTIDGPARIHNKRRLHRENPDANFARIVENILHANKKLEINIRVNVGGHNAEHLEELVEELVDSGVWPGRVHIGLAYLQGGADALPREDYLRREDEFRIHLVRRYNEMTQSRAAKLRFQYPEKLAVGSCPLMVDERRSWVIDSLGDVFRCWDVVGREAYKVGTIDDLLGGGITGVEDWVINEQVREETGCYDCKMAPICGISCPTEYYQARASGEYLGKNEKGDPFCGPWRFGIRHRLVSQYNFWRESPDLVKGFPRSVPERDLVEIDTP